jgi:ABC-type Mn2+/Zn2+ transport system ATPase subunit
VSVADVVMMGRVRKMGLFRWPSHQDRAAVSEALARVGMADLANRQIGELSGGQQQRVFLARALAQQAELLLLDEPLTGLDLPSRDAIMAILAELHGQGVATLTATHDLNQAAENFPRILLLNRRVIAFGAPREVFTAEALAAAYGSQMHILQPENGHWVITDTCCSGGQPPVETVLGHAEAAWATASPIETPRG